MITKTLNYADTPRIHANVVLFDSTALLTASDPALYADQDGYRGFWWVGIVSMNPREREAVIEVYASDYDDEPNVYTVRCSDESLFMEHEQALAEYLYDLETE